jgi:hypothetical protein
MNYPKLPPVFKRNWLAALRSGKYKQADGLLYDKSNNGFCCLGVACNIQGCGKQLLYNRTTIPEKGNGNFKKVPSILRGGYLESNEVVDTLVNMNDDGISFKRIANWIEKHL